MSDSSIERLQKARGEIDQLRAQKIEIAQKALAVNELLQSALTQAQADNEELREFCRGKALIDISVLDYAHEEIQMETEMCEQVMSNDPGLIARAKRLRACCDALRQVLHPATKVVNDE